MPLTWIAQENVVFVDVDGRRSSGRIAVGRPEQVSAVEATCTVALDGLERTWPIRGTSTLQALLLATRFLGMRLHDFISKGGRVVYPDGDDDVTLEALFGALLRAPDPQPSDERG
jgi:hypothetical protein